jgi:L-cystine uptake protein TcyP (sodium:dicarboxylate symporter family)
MDEVALAFWAIAGIGGAATTAAYKVIENVPLAIPP